MSEVLHGNASGNQLNTSKDKTQVYGLAGNDTLISDRKSDALLVGGSGDDSLIMLGGNGTLSGGTGSDTFELNYSATEKISAVIEDLDPRDKIVVNFDGNFALPILSVTSGDDVIWTDGANFNLTLKSARENDYFDGEISDEAWEILKLTNDEREKENLPLLTMADGLTKGAAIRAEEIASLGAVGELDVYKHTRPNGTDFSTVFDDVGKHYSHFGENLQAGAESSAEVMKDWIGSPSHYANIMNPDFLKLGVGYNYKDLSKNEYYWTQLFADSLNNPETVSAEELSGVRPEGHPFRKFIQLTKRGDIYNNTEYGATIAALGGNDKITNTGLIASISGGKDDDTIDNSGSFVTINAGTGNDEINLSRGAKYNLIEYNIGDGSDTVSGLHSTDTLSISGYEYTPVTVGKDVIVSVGAGSIKLVDAPKTFTIAGVRSKFFLLTEGDDKLNNTVGGATIQALGGDDNITNSGSNVTISAGAGNDYINNKGGENVLFVHESGDDTVRGFNSTSTLKVLGKNYSSIESGNDFILTNADTKNFITILNVASLSAINIVDANDRPLEVERVKNIVGTDDPEKFSNGSDDVTIQALGGDDTVTNKGDGVLIDGGADNDSISNDGSDVTITGGGGSDTIKNTGDNNSILGGADDDTIEISGDENTINAEGGDDYISVKGSRNVIEYVAGSGKDVIEGFNQTSTLRISGDVYTSTTSNKDIVVTVGEQTISLVGAADLNKINIVGTSQTETISSNYMDYNGHRYQLFDEGMTWEEAKAYCESLGGHLVVITDAAEQAAVEGLLKEKGTKNSYWMGGFKSDNPKLITLTEGNDTYNNTVEGVTIQALGGNDSITNSSLASQVSINGGADNDTINNYDGINVTLNGTDGNDSINSWGASSILEGGNGDDTINNNEGARVSIDGGVGSDIIDNWGDSSTINGGDGNDWISNDWGEGSSISGGDGDDTISSRGVYGSIGTLSSGLWDTTVNAGAGDDYISLSGGNNQIFYNAGDGSDTITGLTSTDTINILGTTYTRSTISNDVVLTVGDDSIRLIDAAGLTLNIDGTLGSGSTNSKLITLTEGDDTYTNIIGADATILALGGNDSILNESLGSNVSISGAAGNDEIENWGESVTINGGDGDDYIDNFGDFVTINGGADDDEIINGGSFVTIDGGAGNDYITNYDSSVSIDGNSGNDYIDNFGDFVTINGGADDDYIYNDGSSVTIDTGVGDDSIDNRGNSVTINGGDGNDYIDNWNNGNNSTIAGGAGDDSILSNGDSVTIDGGTDDDLVSLSSGAIDHLIQYNSGDGNDTIYGFDDYSTLSIVGATYSTTESGDDVIVSVGENSIRLINAAGLTLNIENDTSPANVADDTTTPFEALDPTEVIMLTTGNDSLYNTVEGAEIQALAGDDTVDNNEANVIIYGGDDDDSLSNYSEGFYTTINGDAGADRIINWGASVSIAAGEGNDYILNESLGAMVTIDAGAGTDRIDNWGVDVSIEGGAGNDSILNESLGSNSTISGGDGADTIENEGSTAYVYGGIGNDYINNEGTAVTIDSGAGLDTINNRISSVTISSGAGDDSIVNESVGAYVSINSGSGNDYIWNGGSNATIDGGDGNDSIAQFDGSGVSISGGAGDDSISNDGGNSLTIAGGAGDDTISLGASASVNLIQYTSGDGSDTVSGLHSTDTLSISGYEYTPVTVGKDVIVSVGAGSIKLVDAPKTFTIAGVRSKFFLLTEGDDKLNNTVGSATIQALGGNDYIYNDDGYSVSIDAGAGDDSIHNEGYNATHSTMDGGAGSDSISGYFWASSILGGADNDLISISNNENTISGGTGDDSISLSSTSANNFISYTSGDGDDTITGFNSTSTLSISGAAYSTTTSGNDVIVTVGNGSIRLIDAATLSALNIDGTLNSSGSWQWVTGETWSYDNWGWNQPDGDGSALMIYNSTGNGWPQGVWNDLNPTGVNGQDFFGKENFGLICEWETIPSSKLIELTEGPDTYSESMESDTTLKALGGNDYINNWSGDSVTIDLGADDDYIINHSSYVLIEGADGSDTVASWIVDDDTLDTSSAYNTIRGGAGDDSIDNHGHHALIEGNNGNDTINNYVGDDGGIHQGYEANYSTVRGGRGNDKIDNHGNHVLIEGGTGNDTIYNNNGNLFDDEAEYSTIYGGAGHDSIINHGASSIIDGANGNDSIYNYSFSVSIGGGADDDFIYNEGSQVSINGNAGDDSIDNHGKNDTILGGTGNDEISLSTASKNNFIRYADGDGNDTVWGATPDDTINILGVESYSSVKSGKNDLLIKVGNGSILLKDARNRPPKITLGESGSSGGTGGGGSGSSGGNSGGGSGGGSNSSGGTSSSSNSNSAASGGNSASGSSGTSSGLSGSSGRGSRLSTRQISATTSPPVQTPRNQIISNYQSGSKINSSEGHTGAFFDGKGNFYSGSTTGAIVIPDATNKLIDLRDAAGNPFIKAYRASNAGVIDGRSFAGFEIINGSAGSDEIYAGVNGSQMIGGTGNDTLTGGRGIDIFVSGKSQGNDLIRNASLLDKISLTDVTLNDITSTRENDKTVSLTFRTGSVITVESKDILSPSFVLSDGSYFFYNSISKSWRVMNQASENQKVYGGGEQTISSYQSGEKILFNAEYRCGSYDGEGNFKVNSSAGSLVVQNAVDKVIDLTNSAGNSIIKAYAASTSGVINGKDLTGYQIINGSAGADVICAGNGGSQLWGGAEADVLIGGDGADTFITGRTHGADLISNASTADNINLNDATLSDIVGTSESNGTISLSFNTGNVINVQSSEPLSARFILADGSAYRYNHARKTWQSA